MRITVKNGKYLGAHVPGPSHNYLGMTFGTAQAAHFEIDVLPPRSENPNKRLLSADEVRPWIEEGVRLAERETGQFSLVSQAEIIADDSRRPEVYRELARRIVTRHVEDQA